MRFSKLWEQPYFHLQIKVTQETPCKLPYYGTIIRGWLGDAFYASEKTKIFKNPDIDVRPFFHYTISNGEAHYISIIFAGDATRLAREFVECISEKCITHIGGINAKIEVIKLEEKKIEILPPRKVLEIKFVSPTTIVENGKLAIRAPSFPLIVKALLRSVNRYSKYYFKKAYPLHSKTSPECWHAEIQNFEIYPFSWEHHTMDGRRLFMRGITGTVNYKVARATHELMKILALAQVFQIGKWLSYGFGKLEVK